MGSSAETCWKQVWRHGQRPGAGRREQKKTKMCEFIHSHTAVWIQHWNFLFLLVGHLEICSVLIVSLRLQCSLHIHAAYSMATRLIVPMLPLSEPNAVGLILAHGTVSSLALIYCLHIARDLRPIRGHYTTKMLTLWFFCCSLRERRWCHLRDEAWCVRVWWRRIHVD